MAGRGRRLGSLGAEWLAAPAGRYNVGFRFRCQLHTNGDAHWLVVILEDPYDGLPRVQVDGAVRAQRTGGGATIGELTLTTPSGDDVLDFGPCGRFRIIRGRVEVVR